MARSAPNKVKAETLRAIGDEVFAVGDDGKPVTNEEQLHRLLWQQALGYTEETRDANGTLRRVAFPPDRTIQKLLLEQLSGKPATVQVEEQVGPTAAEKVSALVKDRINALVQAKNNKDV